MMPIDAALCSVSSCIFILTFQYHSNCSYIGHFNHTALDKAHTLKLARSNTVTIRYIPYSDEKKCNSGVVVLCHVMLGLNANRIKRTWTPVVFCFMSSVLRVCAAATWDCINVAIFN